MENRCKHQVLESLQACQAVDEMALAFPSPHGVAACACMHGPRHSPPLQLLHSFLQERHPGSQLLLVLSSSRQLPLCLSSGTLLLQQLLAQL